MNPTPYEWSIIIIIFFVVVIYGKKIRNLQRELSKLKEGKDETDEI